MNTDTKQRFLRDTSEHQMTIARDDDVYRHLIFKRPGSSTYRFDLITWPGYLCYTGDMGTYVFTRVHDMLEFFRKSSMDSSIDLRYWAEKVEGQDKNSGVLEFSERLFKQEVHAYVRSYVHGMLEEVREEADATKQAAVAAARELRAAVRYAVLRVDEGEVRAWDAVSNFHFHAKAYEYNTYRWAEHFGEKRDFAFLDFFETDCREYTLRFLWCCHALVWGILQYDAAKLEQTKAAEVAA